MPVTDRLKLASDVKSTVYGKEFHTFTTLTRYNKEVSTSCVITSRLLPSRPINYQLQSLHMRPVTQSITVMIVMM